MARNHEKQYGKLNRLILAKEQEEFEKANPKRPRLDLLDSPEEIQKWIPSIKKDIDFYLKKSQVTCYSDQQIEDCNVEIVKLEKEFKAFIRKIKKLTSGVLDAIPWTSRPYKRKNTDPIDAVPRKEFEPIDTPLLNKSKKDTEPNYSIDLQSMNEPLIFNSTSSDNHRKKISFSLKQPENASSKQKNIELLSLAENSALMRKKSIDMNPITANESEVSSLDLGDNVKINQQNKLLFNLGNQEECAIDRSISVSNNISHPDSKHCNSLDSNFYSKSNVNCNAQTTISNGNKIIQTVELNQKYSGISCKLVNYNSSDSDSSN